MRRPGPAATLLVALACVAGAACHRGVPEAAAPSAPRSPPRGDVVDGAFISVSVADVEASAAWYARVLGLELARSIDAPDGAFAIRILRRDGLMVELIEAEGSLGPDDLVGPHGRIEKRVQVRGLFKAGFFVDDVDAFHAELGRLGVDRDAEVMRDPEMDLAFFVFRDPDGNRLQAFQRTRTRP